MALLPSTWRANARPVLALAAAWPALLVAVFAMLTTPHAPWRLLGPLSTALVAGLIVRGARDAVGRAPEATESDGLRLLATHVLRAAVVVSALRLDWNAIAAAGPRPWIVAAVAVVGGLGAFALLSRALGVRGTLPALLAIGTSVCGAAAITAAAPRLQAADHDVTRAIAVVSVLGAALAVGMVVLHAATGLGGDAYALLSGGALHEVAHVAAAGAAVPEVAGLALLTKLARVAMLPIGLSLVAIAGAIPRASGAGSARVPGLAIAFFVVSLSGSAPGWIPGLAPGWITAWAALRGALLDASSWALAASMAAIGLRLAPRELARTDRRAVGLALAGAVAVLALVTAAIALTA